MNWKSTTALLLLAGAAGAWFFLGDTWKPRLGIGTAHTEPPASSANRALDMLTPDDITFIKVVFPSGEPLTVERADAKSPWKMPGNWPPRFPEVQELARTLGTLRSRFHPEVVGGEPNLSQYGLAPEQKPIAVTLKYRHRDASPPTERTLEMTLGEPTVPEGENAFTRSSFARIVSKGLDGAETVEIIRLGPDVMPVVGRPVDSYRRRQLFPHVERVRILGGDQASPFGPPSSDTPTTISIPGEATETITVAQRIKPILGFDFTPLTTYTLTRLGKLPEGGVYSRGGEVALRSERLADAWRLTAPIEDNPDPERLRSVLTTITDLWVEEFLHTAPAEAELGFDADSRTVTVKTKGGEPLTLRFGGIARMGEREETITIPGQPGQPPRSIPRKVPVEFRYARVDGNPQIFIVSGEKLGDLFVSSASLVDPRVARFESDEVQKLTLNIPGRPPLTLLRRKGNLRAANPDDRTDRWVITAKPNDFPADGARVNELLGHLTRFRAESNSRITYPAVKPTPRVTITVAAREQRAEGEPEAPTRTYELQLGPPDFLERLLPLSSPGQPRVTMVDDRLNSATTGSWVGSLLFPETIHDSFEQPAIAYRDRKLLDTTDTQIKSLSVVGGFGLRRDPDGWKLTAPIQSEADAEKAEQLAKSLAELRATEYLSETPTPDDLAGYGLDKPAHIVTILLGNGRTYTLEIGAARSGKSELFARLDHGAVFGLPATTTESLATGALGLLPLKVWNAEPVDVTALEITRYGDAAKDSLRLTRDAENWKLSGPFNATVPAANAQPLLAGLAKLTADRYKSLTSADPAEFGFDKPLLAVKITYTERKPGADVANAVTRSVIVGGSTPDGQNRYARLDAPNSPIFIVSSNFVGTAQTPTLELPDRALLSLDAGRIAGLRVVAGKPDEAFTLSRDQAGKWTAEGTTFAVDPIRIGELTGAATRPKISRLAAYGDAIKWEDYGLAKPDTTITVTLSGEKPETHTITLGNPDPTGSRFARIDDKPAVAVIPGPIAETLTRRRFDYADRTLLTFDSTTVNSIVRVKDKEELELVPGANVGWDIVKPAKQKADGFLVDELVDSLGRLRAERVAAYGKRDEVFKQYGLEPPAVAVTISVGDKPELKTLRIGNPVDAAKPEGERYAAIDSNTAEVIVGVLPPRLVGKLLASPLAFRDRALGSFVDADRAVFERGDRKVTFVKNGSTWKMTEPVAAEAENAALGELFSELGSLRADTWVGEKGKDLAPFGLDKPEARWTLFDGDRAVLVLHLGKKAPDGRLHAIADGKDLVGLLTLNLSTRLLAEYRRRKIWELDASQAESLEIRNAAGKFSFTKNGTLWVDPAKPNDILDPKSVPDLLGILGNLQAERYAVDKDANLKLFGLEKPEAAVTVTSAMGATSVLEVGGVVGGTDGKQRYARVASPGRTDVFVLSVEDTAGLLRPRESYLLKK
jgi:hypothetical protein